MRVRCGGGRGARLPLDHPLHPFRLEGIGNLDSRSRRPFWPNAGDGFGLFLFEINANDFHLHRRGHHIVPFGQVVDNRLFDRVFGLRRLGARSQEEKSKKEATHSSSITRLMPRARWNRQRIGGLQMLQLLRCLLESGKGASRKLLLLRHRSRQTQQIHLKRYDIHIRLIEKKQPAFRNS